MGLALCIGDKFIQTPERKVHPHAKTGCFSQDDVHGILLEPGLNYHERPLQRGKTA